jgi:hypothetical protein
MRYDLIGGAVLCSLVMAMPAVAAQACRDDIRATAPDSRFSHNGNGTVTDLATGLIWKQCAEGLSGTGCTAGSVASLTWAQALQRAADADFAGSSLWRLPNKNELASLIERRCYAPAINARFFPNTPSSWFWSSSPNAYDSDNAWFVDLSHGGVGDTGKGGAYYHEGKKDGKRREKGVRSLLCVKFAICGR